MILASLNLLRSLNLSIITQFGNNFILSPLTCIYFVVSDQREYARFEGETQKAAFKNVRLLG